MEFSYSEANLKIFLHAITGSGHPKTTRIVGKVGNPRVVILIPTIFWTHPLRGGHNYCCTKRRN
jgi:hypothetical protein